ncbi:hypothetical protein LEMLEM_LOCUS22668 [Lemmus lemmus]
MTDGTKRSSALARVSQSSTANTQGYQEQWGGLQETRKTLKPQHPLHSSPQFSRLPHYQPWSLMSRRLAREMVRDPVAPESEGISGKKLLTAGAQGKARLNRVPAGCVQFTFRVGAAGSVFSAWETFRSCWVCSFYLPFGLVNINKLWRGYFLEYVCFDDDDDEDDDNANNDSFNPHKAYPNSKEPATLTRPKDRNHIPTATQKTRQSLAGDCHTIAKKWHINEAPLQGSFLFLSPLKTIRCFEGGHGGSHLAQPSSVGHSSVLWISEAAAAATVRSSTRQPSSVSPTGRTTQERCGALPAEPKPGSQLISPNPGAELRSRPGRDSRTSCTIPDADRQLGTTLR